MIPKETEELTDDLDRLRHQWRIVPTQEIESCRRNGWASKDLNKHYVLEYHPSARVVALGREGDREFILVGIAVDPRSGANANHVDVSGDLEKYCLALIGTFAVLRIDPKSVVVSADAAGLMSVYYRDTWIASSPSLFLNVERRTEVDQQYRFAGTDDWYPGSLTPFIGVSALLANHTLRLPDLHTERFWPASDPAKIGIDDAVEEIASLLVGSVSRLPEYGSVLMSLTGGRDSRVNLAAAREVLDKIASFTIEAKGGGSKDVALAAALAKDHGFSHTIHQNVKPSESVLTAYDEMARGLSIGTRRAVVGVASAIGGPGKIHLNGNLGGVAKAFFWHNANPESVRLRSLMKEFRQKPPFIKTHTQEWLSTVPELAPSTVYNLMYLEQRGSRWMGPGEMSSMLFYESFTPWSSRRIFELLNGLPVGMQRSGKLLDLLVGHMWPELLETPFSSGTSNLSRLVPKRVKYWVKRSGHLIRGPESDSDYEA